MVRPSIVSATWKEPFPGWVESFNGANGMMACVGTGVMRTLRAGPNKRADLVPADSAVNLICAVAFKIGVGDDDARSKCK